MAFFGGEFFDSEFFSVSGAATGGQGSQAVDAVALLQFSAATTAGQGEQTADASGLQQFSAQATSGQGSQTVDAADSGVTATAESGQGGQTSNAAGETPIDQPVDTVVGQFLPPRPRPRVIHGTATSGQGGQTVDAVGKVIRIKSIRRREEREAEFFMLEIERLAA